MHTPLPRQRSPVRLPPRLASWALHWPTDVPGAGSQRCQRQRLGLAARHRALVDPNPAGLAESVARMWLLARARAYSNSTALSCSVRFVRSRAMHVECLDLGPPVANGAHGLLDRVRRVPAHASENEMRCTFTPTSCHLSTMSSIIPSRRSRSKGPSKLDPKGLPSVMEADSTSDQPQLAPWRPCRRPVGPACGCSPDEHRHRVTVSDESLRCGAVMVAVFHGPATGYSQSRVPPNVGTRSDGGSGSVSMCSRSSSMATCSPSSTDSQ